MRPMRIRNENGASLVEFAIISPLLFVVLFGVIEFAVLLYDRAIITNASREGARAGIVYDTAFRNDDDTVNGGAVTAKVNEVVSDYCADNLISFGSGSAPTVEVAVGGRAGDPVRVTVTYPFQFLAFSSLISLIGGSAEEALTLTAETVMRLE